MRTITSCAAAHILFFVIVLGSLHNGAFPQGKDVMIAPGDPPLTQAMVDKTVALLKWVLDIDISASNKSKLQKVIARGWQTGSEAEMQSTLNIVDIHDKLMAMPQHERDIRKTPLRDAIMENLRKEPDDEMSRILVAAYEDARARAPQTGARDVAGTATSSSIRVGGDGITGIYRMVRPRSININSPMSNSGVWIEYITFLPNGNVYWTLPPEGLLYFDPDVAKRADPDDWGTYQIRDGQIHILRGPERRPYVITRTGDRLNNPPSLGKGSFRPVPAADGLRLNGSYRRTPTEPAIAFTLDGKFRDEGIFRYFGSGQRPDGSIYSDDGKGGSGTYIIEQNTLELRYSDGRVKRAPFIAFPEELAKKPAVGSFILRREETMTRY